MRKHAGELQVQAEVGVNTSLVNIMHTTVSVARTMPFSQTMEFRKTRFIPALLASTVTLLFAAPSLALGFTVHSYDLGEQIQLTSGRQV